jgi:hypothetical protein
MNESFDPTKAGTIWAFDPGSNFSGLAAVFYEPLGTVADLLPAPEQDSYWAQFSNAVELYDHFYNRTHYKNAVVLVEDYTHGGTFTKEAKQTVEIVGFLTRQLPRDGFKVVVRGKDQRLSGQSEAARLMGGTVVALKKDPARKDAFSALAHCITYYREMEALRVRD